MTRPRMVALLVLLVSYSPLAPAEQAELLKNGNLAEPGRKAAYGVVPRYWGLYKGTDDNLAGLQIVAGAGPTGNSAYVITGRNACLIQNVPAVKAGDSIRLSFWSKADLSRGGRFECRIKFLGEKGYLPMARTKMAVLSEKRGAIKPGARFEWRLFEIAGEALPETTRGANVIFYVKLKQGESASFADFSLKRIPAAAKPKARNRHILVFPSHTPLGDVAISLPRVDDSIAYHDFGTGKARGLGLTASKEPFRTTTFAGRRCVELSGRNFMLVKLSPEFLSTAKNFVGCVEYQNGRPGTVHFSYYPARLTGQVNNAVWHVAPGRVLKRWRARFYRIHDPVVFKDNHLRFYKREGETYVSRIWVKRFSDAEFKDFEAYEQWLDSVSTRYTEAAAGIEFVWEDLRQLQRARTFVGHRDAAIPAWGAEGVEHLVKEIAEVRHGFAWGHESGRADLILKGDAHQIRRTQTEATLRKMLARITSLRAQTRKAQEQLTRDTTAKPPWARADAYALQPPDVKANKLGEAPIWCATEGSKVDWEPVKELGLDGIHTQCWAHSLSLARNCLPDGTFDFINFDNALEEFEKHDLRVAAYLIIGAGRIFQLPRWFENKYGDDIRYQGGDGRVFEESGNMWHPALRKLLRDFFAAFSKRYRQDKRIISYHLLDEALHKMRQGYAGYSPCAREAFRTYLRKKYKTIEALNTAWGTKHRNFSEIQPPSEEKRASAVRGTPHINEFTLFVEQSWDDFMNMMIDAFHQNDPNHPIGGQASQLGIDPTAQRWSMYGVNTGGGGVAKHDFQGRLNAKYVENLYAENRLLYHLAWWVTNEGDFGAVGDDVIRQILIRNIWHISMWDSLGINFYGLYVGMNRGWNMLDPSTDTRLIRDCIAPIPMMKAKLTRIWPVLRQTRVVKPSVALVANRMTAALSPATGHGSVGRTLYKWLHDSHRAAFILPEAVIADGREDLSGFKVLICSHGIHHMPGYTDRLLQWVRQGGVLIVLGPEGLYTPLGKPDCGLMKELFGISRVEYSPKSAATLGALNLDGQAVDLTQTGKRFWLIREMAPRENTTVRAKFRDGSPAVVHSIYGKGEALYCPAGTEGDPSGQVFLAQFMDQRLPPRMAWCDSNQVELMVREDDKGERYLVMVHYNPEHSVSIQLALGSVYPRVADLCTLSPTPVPVKTSHGMTTFTMELLPGEGTLLALGKPDAGAAVSAQKQKVFLRLLTYSAAIRRAKMDGFDVGKDEERIKRARSQLAKGDHQRADVTDDLDNLQKRLASVRRDKLARAVSHAGLQVRKAALQDIERARQEMFLGLIQKAFRDGYVDKVPLYLDELSKAGFLPVRKDVTIDFVCPRAAKAVKLDGNLDEWSRAKGGEMPFETASDNRITSAADLSGRFRAMYDDKNLYFAVTVKDDAVQAYDGRDNLFKWDAVEIYLNFLDDHGLPNRVDLIPEPTYGPDDVQLVFNPNGLGCSKAYTNPINHYIPEKLCAARRTQDGYVLEVAVPWNAVPLRPVSGYTIGLNVRVIDTDNHLNLSTVVWKRNTYQNSKYTTGWGRMQLE